MSVLEVDSSTEEKIWLQVVTTDKKNSFALLLFSRAPFSPRGGTWLLFPTMENFMDLEVDPDQPRWLVDFLGRDFVCGIRKVVISSHPQAE